MAGVGLLVLLFLVRKSLAKRQALLGETEASWLPALAAPPIPIDDIAARPLRAPSPARDPRRREEGPAGAGRGARRQRPSDVAQQLRGWLAADSDCPRRPTATAMSENLPAPSRSPASWSRRRGSPRRKAAIMASLSARTSAEVFQHLRRTRSTSSCSRSRPRRRRPAGAQARDGGVLGGRAGPGLRVPGRHRVREGDPRAGGRRRAGDRDHGPAVDLHPRHAVRVPAQGSTRSRSSTSCSTSTRRRSRW